LKAKQRWGKDPRGWDGLFWAASHGFIVPLEKKYVELCGHGAIIGWQAA